MIESPNSNNSRSDILVPCLPESAPFTPEQRAYLNGFLAGLFSRKSIQSPIGAASTAGVEALIPVTILFGSQTGTAEMLAKRLAKEAGKHGLAPTVTDLGQYQSSRFSSERFVLLLTSTYGDGEPPDNAKMFWDWLHSPAAPHTKDLRYSVLALGDRNYPQFCACGAGFDKRLEILGGTRILQRTDCDTDYEDLFTQWMSSAIHAIKESVADTGPAIKIEISEEKSNTDCVSGYDRKNPLSARLMTNRRLTPEGSDRDRRHFEISLENSTLEYAAGDALGVIPSNCMKLVEQLLGALSYKGDEAVAIDNNGQVTISDALHEYFEITRIPRPLLQSVAERSADENLKSLMTPGSEARYQEYITGRDILDLLLSQPSVKFAPGEFVRLLSKLKPRLYSIASSPKISPRAVHLTVAIVRYESLGRTRQGVCSSFLADRVSDDTPVPVFVHNNKTFRPPMDHSRPMIMVGPGTGIAPFRGFLQERKASGAIGKNWLFFGEQRARNDFFYRDELESMHKDGVLTRFDTAFSRDQIEKIYVQDKMKEHAKELFSWLEEGAHFYVCGDASRMAKDVDQALQQIVSTVGAMTKEKAIDYVTRLKSEGRYCRDVY